MNTLTEKEIIILIRMVRERPSLYDKQERLYKSKEAREAHWKDIAFKLNADARDMKIAWRSLRDRFTKTYNSSMQYEGQKRENERRKYKLFPLLFFLAKFTNSKGAHKDNKVEFDDNELSQMTTTFDYEPSVSESITALPLPEISQDSSLDFASNSSFEPKVQEFFTEEIVESEVPIPSPIISRKRKHSDNSVTAIESSPKKRDNIDTFFETVANTVRSYNLSVSEMALLQCDTLTYVTQRLEKIRLIKEARKLQR